MTMRLQTGAGRVKVIQQQLPVVLECQILSLSLSSSLPLDCHLFTSYCAVRADLVFQTLSSPLCFLLFPPLCRQTLQA